MFFIKWNGHARACVCVKCLFAGAVLLLYVCVCVSNGCGVDGGGTLVLLCSVVFPQCVVSVTTHN